MIQRIQSVYLFLAVLVIALLLGTNAGLYSAKGLDKWTGPTDGLVQVNYQDTRMIPAEAVDTVIEPNSMLSGAMIANGVLMILCIFLYGNRKLQLRLCWLNFVLIALVYLAMWMCIDHARTWLFEIHEAKWNTAAFVPLLLPVLNLLAIRGIRKDQELIRSMDRLR